MTFDIKRLVKAIFVPVSALLTIPLFLLTLVLGVMNHPKIGLLLLVALFSYLLINA